jgi:tRNA A37 threonylcarbamoyladenosine dehydratase
MRPPGNQRYMLRAYDHDTLELHNLNRSSLFLLNQVGRKKVIAIQNAVRTVLDANNGRSRENSTAFLRDVSDQMIDRTSRLKLGITVDARDTMDPTKMVPNSWIKLAYN